MHNTKTNMYVKSHNNILEWKTAIICAVFLSYTIMQDYLFGILHDELSALITTSAAKYGYLASLYLYAVAIALIPVGLLGDRVNNKKLLIIGVFLCISAAFSLYIMPTYLGCMFYQILSGISNSFAFIIGIRVIKITCIKHQVLAVGVFFAFANFSGTIVEVPYVYLKGVIGWQNMLLVNALVGMLIMFVIIILLSIPDMEKTNNKQDKSIFFEIKQSFIDLLHACKDKNNWLCGLFCGIFALPDSAFADLWGPLYFTQKFNISDVQAGFIISFFLIGLTITSPLIGLVVDKYGKSKVYMFLGSVFSMMVFFIVMMMTELSWTILSGLFLFLGFMNCVYILGFASVQNNTPEKHAGAALAFAAFLMNIFIARAKPSLGWLLDKYWDGTLQDGSPVYSANVLDNMLVSIVIAFGLAAIISLFIKDTSSN